MVTSYIPAYLDEVPYREALTETERRAMTADDADVKIYRAFCFDSYL